jgi:hypothetical protein
MEFCDIVDRVADALVMDGTVSKKGLGQAGARGWWGRYVRAVSGHVFLIGVLPPSWATAWPTPWWLVFDDSRSEVSQALSVLADDPRTPSMVTGDDSQLRIRPRMPRGPSQTWSAPWNFLDLQRSERSAN